MTTAQEASPASSAAKVLEFTTDLVVHRRHVAADGVVALDLKHPQGDDLPAWEPGAHIDLLLDEGLVRQYSLCGDPRDATIWRVGVLLDPQSRGGSRHVHENLQEGSSVRVRGPRNHFALVDSPRYLFIAGGIGITPIMSMVEAANRAGSDWTLLYLGRKRTTMAFEAGLSDTHGERVTVWSDEKNGRFFDLAAALKERLEGTLVYCCGPEPLLAAVEEHSGHWPEGSLHIERFAAKTPGEEASGEALDRFQVVCQRSGVAVDVSEDMSILEALEDADIPILSSCLEGICGTCEATVLEGTPDHRDSVLTDAERTSGNRILTCVSRSCSEKLVLDL
jgi:ferredoxin-NADP reductase